MMHIKPRGKPGALKRKILALAPLMNQRVALARSGIAPAYIVGSILFGISGYVAFRSGREKHQDPNLLGLV